MKCVLAISIDNSIFDKWTKTVWEGVPVISTVQNVEKKQYFMIILSLIDYALEKKKKMLMLFMI